MKSHLLKLLQVTEVTGRKNMWIFQSNEIVIDKQLVVISVANWETKEFKTNIQNNIGDITIITLK